MHAGQPAFPGGGVDPGDDGPIGAALREAQEETGLDPAGVTVVGTMPEVYVARSANRVTPVLGWWHTPCPVHPAAPDEVDAVERVPIAELVDPRNRLRLRGPGGYIGPAFRVRGLLVWGFTGRLLSGVLAAAGFERPGTAPGSRTSRPTPTGSPRANPRARYGPAPVGGAIPRSGPATGVPRLSADRRPVGVTAVVLGPAGLDRMRGARVCRGRGETVRASVPVPLVSSAEVHAPRPAAARTPARRGSAGCVRPGASWAVGVVCRSAGRFAGLDGRTFRSPFAPSAVPAGAGCRGALRRDGGTPQPAAEVPEPAGFDRRPFRVSSVPLGLERLGADRLR